MAYLIYNSGEIRSTRSTYSDFLTLGQIVDSQCSYESPKKVGSIEELDKWFGTQYSGYEYHCELLREGLTLLLYRPITSPVAENSIGYIDYTGYYKNPEVYDEIPLPEDRVVYYTLTGDYRYENGEFIELQPGECGEWEVIRVGDVSEVTLPEVPRRKTIFNGSYVWSDELYDYVDINLLPQNLRGIQTSGSWGNRETLSLSTTGYCSPRVTGTPEYEGLDLTELKEYYQEDQEGKLTYSFRLDFTKATLGDTGYICVTVGPGKVRHMIYFSEDPIGLPGSDYVSVRNRHLAKTQEEVWEVLKGLGFKRVGDSFWSHYQMPIDYFYKVPGLVLEPNDRVNQDLIALIQSRPRISFVSRTIGKHEVPLRVSIEKLETETDYQVIIERPGIAQEVHQGNLFPSADSKLELLSTVINRDSELVTVTITNINPETGRQWKPIVADYIFDTPIGMPETGIVYCRETKEYWESGVLLTNPDLPVGSWELKGATEELWGPSDWDRSLGCLQESEYTMDFLLIPEISRYTGGREVKDTESWYSFYPRLLEFCKANNTQALIVNQDFGEVTEELPKEPLENWIYLVKGTHEWIWMDNNWCRIYSKPTPGGLHKEVKERFLTWTLEEGWVDLPVENSDGYDTLINLPARPKEGTKYLVRREWIFSDTGESIGVNLIGTAEVAILPEKPREGILYRVTGGTYYRYEDGTWFPEVRREYCIPELNEFVWNYVESTDSYRNPIDKDPENRLVYFYRDIIQPSGEVWPAYSIFIENLITGKFDQRTKGIFYGSPVNDPLDYKEDDYLPRLLETMKSNYLVTDRQGYYYRRLHNHPGTGRYQCSIIERYIRSSLTRLIEKHRWDILGQATYGKATEYLKGLLSILQKTRPQVAWARLDDYWVSREMETAEIRLSIGISEIIDKDIKLNVILNYT